jgi:hypothetical protein
MARKKAHTLEEIVAKLRQTEVLVDQARRWRILEPLLPGAPRGSPTICGIRGVSHKGILDFARQRDSVPGYHRCSNLDTSRNPSSR